MGETYIVIRTVTPEECPWLDAPVGEGTKVDKYYGHTYGCITNSGEAVRIPGIEGFVELPKSALRSTTN